MILKLLSFLKFAWIFNKYEIHVYVCYFQTSIYIRALSVYIKRPFWNTQMHQKLCGISMKWILFILVIDFIIRVTFKTTWKVPFYWVMLFSSTFKVQLANLCFQVEAVSLQLFLTAEADTWPEPRMPHVQHWIVWPEVRCYIIFRVWLDLFSFFFFNLIFTFRSLLYHTCTSCF